MEEKPKRSKDARKEIALFLYLIIAVLMIISFLILSTFGPDKNGVTVDNSRTVNGPLPKKGQGFGVLILSVFLLGIGASFAVHHWTNRE